MKVKSSSSFVAMFAEVVVVIAVTAVVVMVKVSSGQ